MKELKNIRSPMGLLYYFIHFEIVSGKIEPTQNRRKITDFYPKNTPKIFGRIFEVFLHLGLT